MTNSTLIILITFASLSVLYWLSGVMFDYKGGKIFSTIYFVSGIVLAAAVSSYLFGSSYKVASFAPYILPIITLVKMKESIELKKKAKGRA